MDTLRIAVPSAVPGGLDAPVDAHFGHCEMYTVVDIKDRHIAAVGTLPNVPHGEGGCMAPVAFLAENGINVLIAGGMGMRPLLAFREIGIDVYFGGDAPSVRAAVHACMAGSLPQFAPADTCAG